MAKHKDATSDKKLPKGPRKGQEQPTPKTLKIPYAFKAKAPKKRRTNARCRACGGGIRMNKKGFSSWHRQSDAWRAGRNGKWCPGSHQNLNDL